MSLFLIHHQRIHMILCAVTPNSIVNVPHVVKHDSVVLT